MIKTESFEYYSYLMSFHKEIKDSENNLYTSKN